MQRRASRWWGAVMARVGQASMQRVHLPQWSPKGGSGRQVEGGEELGEEEPGAEPAVDLDGGLAVPAEAGVGGEVAFEHRAGVDVAALGAAEVAQGGVEVAELFLDEVVVVVVPGVAGDAVAAGCFGERRSRESSSARGRRPSGSRGAPRAGRSGVRGCAPARPCRRGSRRRSIRGSRRRGRPRPAGAIRQSSKPSSAARCLMRSTTGSLRGSEAAGRDGAKVDFGRWF